jgi:predicted peptidase
VIDVILTGLDQAQALKTLPVWAFHGAKDNVVPLAESERMVGALKRIGAKDVKLTVYPNAEHNSWTETYNNPELYEWLLKQKR